MLLGNLQVGGRGVHEGGEDVVCGRKGRKGVAGDIEPALLKDALDVDRRHLDGWLPEDCMWLTFERVRGKREDAVLNCRWKEMGAYVLPNRAYSR